LSKFIKKRGRKRNRRVANIREGKKTERVSVIILVALTKREPRPKSREMNLSCEAGKAGRVFGFPVF